MTDYIRIPFANDASGSDKVAIDTATQPDGKVSMQSGYGTDYSRNPQTDVLAKKVERSKTNWLFNLITKILQKYQQTGVPDFITSAENNGSAFSYAKYAQVIKDGVIYESLEDGNTDTPPSVKWRNASINDNLVQYGLTENLATLNASTADLNTLLNGKYWIHNTNANRPQLPDGSYMADFVLECIHLSATDGIQVAENKDHKAVRYRSSTTTFSAWVLRANAAGDSNQVFSVATASQPSHAIPKSQFDDRTALKIVAAARFTPSTTTVLYNVGGISRPSTGFFVITFQTAQPDTNYLVMPTCSGPDNQAGNVSTSCFTIVASAYTTAGFKLTVGDNNTDGNIDPAFMSFVVYRL